MGELRTPPDPPAFAKAPLDCQLHVSVDIRTVVSRIRAVRSRPMASRVVALLVWPGGVILQPVRVAEPDESGMCVAGWITRLIEPPGLHRGFVALVCVGFVLQSCGVTLAEWHAFSLSFRNVVSVHAR